MIYYKKLNESFNKLVTLDEAKGGEQRFISFLDILKEDLEGEKVDIQPMSKEEVKEYLKDALKRAFYTLRPIESHSKEFMVLPDGTQLSSMTTEEAPDIGEPQYDTSGEAKYNHIVEYFNSIFEDFMNVTESVAVVPVSGMSERFPFLIYLNSKGITEAQYRIIQMSVKPKVENNKDMDLYFRVYKPNKKFINFTRKRGEDSKTFTDKIINMIKNFYSTGTLKEDIGGEQENTLAAIDSNYLIDAFIKKMKPSPLSTMPEFLPFAYMPQKVFILPDGTLFNEKHVIDTLNTFFGFGFASDDLKELQKDFPLFTINLIKKTKAVPVFQNRILLDLTDNVLTDKQFEALDSFVKALRGYIIENRVVVIYPKNISVHSLNDDKISDKIKSYYKTGKIVLDTKRDVTIDPSNLEEDINHREVYKSLTFSDTPKLGPIFISRDGEFVNVNPEGAHSEIFGDEDYSGDDYYTLHDAFGLIKANSGNKMEPFAYIDIWVVPNPAQKKAIIDWMYFLIENGRKNIQINTPWMSKTGDFSSDSNKIYSLESDIPEDIYDDVVRSL